MRKSKSLIREYWELKKRLRLMTLSILVVSSSLLLLSNSSLNFNLHFAWSLIPYVLSFFMANFVLNKKFNGTQTQHIGRFVLRFFTAKRMIRPLLLNISFVVALLGLFILFGCHSGLDKIDMFFDTMPFMMVVGLGAMMRPDLISAKDEEWESPNNLDSSLDLPIKEPEYESGMLDLYASTSLFNPGNPASMLNITHPLNPSNM